MDSHISGVIQYISDLDGAATFDPPLGGISPVPLPAGATYPYITVQEVTGIELESLGGRSGLEMTIMQVNCFDPDYEGAYQLRAAIKDNLLDLAGASMGTLTADGINHVMDAELYESDKEVHQLITRLQIWWIQ